MYICARVQFCVCAVLVCECVCLCVCSVTHCDMFSKCRRTHTQCVTFMHICATECLSVCIGEWNTICRAPLREMLENVYVVVKKDVIREHDVCMTVSIETSSWLATPPKSTKSRNSNFSISRCANWEWDFALRVDFLLKTDSGYPRDAEVTLFTLANPEQFHLNF